VKTTGKTVDRSEEKTAGCGKVSDGQKIEERKDKL